MSLESKVVWEEGMFISPQHFQQQERYVERYIEGKCSAMGSYLWGIQTLDIDNELLKLGKISVTQAKGIFPDGTPFNFPDVENPPPVIELNELAHDVTVYLAIPVKRPGSIDILPNSDSQGLARYYSSGQAVRDVTMEGSENLKLSVGHLRIRLLTDNDDLSGYVCIGVLKILESRDDKNILLDEEFIPTCLTIQASVKLKNFLSELNGLLHHRAEAIARRLADTRSGGTAEIADYMLLQVINRLEPLSKHLSTLEDLHPLILYRDIVQMAGELSTFFAKDKRAPDFSAYLHHDLQISFSQVIENLRLSLSMVYEQTAIALELIEKNFGIRVSKINDRSMLDSSMFILAASADMVDEKLRTQLPSHIKIASVERIRQLVNAAMPGINIKPLPVCPRQIPYRAGYHYFELETRSEYWQELKSSGGIAIHLAGDFPGIQLEFWAIRQ